MTERRRYRNWVGRQWVSGADTERDGEAFAPHWNKYEWVGDLGHGRRPDTAPRAEEMPEGESALSGFRHNPGNNHWAHHAPSTP